jgi:hypothetical protein
MKRIVFAAAALAALYMSGCRQEVLITPGEEGSLQSGKAGMSIMFSMPAAMGEVPGNRQYSVGASTVELFVFEADGKLAGTGGHTRFDDMAAFSRSVVGSHLVYQLKYPYIETLPGYKKVYMGVDVPATLFADFAGNETDMLALVANATQTATPDGFTIFSQGESVVLEDDLADTVAIEGVEPGGSNIVKMSVGLTFGVSIKPWGSGEDRTAI